MSSKKFNAFKDFQSDQIQRSSRKMCTAHYACRNADLNLTLVSGTTNNGGSGGGARGAGLPLFLHQTEARRAEKNFFGDPLSPPPPYLRGGMTGAPLSQGVDPALTNAFIFQIINSLIESWGVRLTCRDRKKSLDLQISSLVG